MDKQKEFFIPEEIEGLPPSPSLEFSATQIANADHSLSSQSCTAANMPTTSAAALSADPGSYQYSTPPDAPQSADHIATPTKNEFGDVDILDIDDINVNLEDNDLYVSDDVDRVDHVKTHKALEDLRADAVRCDGQLKRADVDRLYVKRGLSPIECAFIERGLKEAGVSVDESHEDDEAALKPEISEAVADIWKSARRQPFLSDLEERACGRAIGLSRQAEEAVRSGSSIDPDYLARVHSEAHEAQRRLLETNLRWVARIANRFRLPQGMEPVDLLQEGAIGLLRATEKYDPKMGFRFKTYATWWIRQAIGRALDDKSRTIRLPVHLHEKVRKLKRARLRILAETGQEPTYEALGIAIGDTAERAAKLTWLADRSEVTSIEAPIAEDLKIEDVLSIEDVKASDSLEDYDRRRVLSATLLDLSPREERVVRLRFGINLNSDQTLEEIGKSFGVTRERIRQIEAKGLKKLRHPSRIWRMAGLID